MPLDGGAAVEPRRSPRLRSARTAPFRCSRLPCLDRPNVRRQFLVGVCLRLAVQVLAQGPVPDQLRPHQILEVQHQRRDEPVGRCRQTGSASAGRPARSFQSLQPWSARLNTRVPARRSTTAGGHRENNKTRRRGWWRRAQKAPPTRQAPDFGCPLKLTNLHHKKAARRAAEKQKKLTLN